MNDGDNLDEMFNPTVSTIGAAHETATKDYHLRVVLADIRSDKWAKQVADTAAAYTQGWANAVPKEVNGVMETLDRARIRGGKDAAGPHKKKLPGILFSGTFRKRSAKELIQHSGLICADLDELGDRLEGTFEQVCAEPHTLACFRSPTGTGLKVLFRCDPAKPHLDSFKAAARHMLEQFGVEIDQACKDVSRICFVSHDPEMFEADDAEVLAYPTAAIEFVPSGLNPRTGLELTPGDDYDQRGDLPTLLTSHGWKKDGVHGWIRPDKTSGISATFDKIPGRFYVFSSSTEFEANHTYRPWHVYAILECGGDFSAAAKKLGEAGFGHQIKSRQQENLERVAGGGAEAALPPVRPITSYAYPSDDDPNMLLGSEDYLGRGGGLLFVSHAGAGKSSWAYDACMMWALGKVWMGIKSHQPRKALIIQAEDSDRYIGKIFASFAHANKLTPEEVELLGKNCVIVRLKGVSGPAFFSALSALAKEHNPDLVIINPIYLYAEGDITRSEFAQPFLLGLDYANREEKWAYILIHHTGKPAARDKSGKRPELEDWESAYMGFGSSYLANWPRCTILLEPVPGQSGHFQIKLGKGGYNAGVTQANELGMGATVPATRIAIRHSTDRMSVNGRDRPVFYWEVDDAPPAAQESPRGGKPRKYHFDSFRDIFPKSADRALGKKALLRYAEDIAPIKETAFREMLHEATEDGLLTRIVSAAGFSYYLDDQSVPR